LAALEWSGSSSLQLMELGPAPANANCASRPWTNSTILSNHSSWPHRAKSHADVRTGARQREAEAEAEAEPKPFLPPPPSNKLCRNPKASTPTIIENPWRRKALINGGPTKKKQLKKSANFVRRQPTIQKSEMEKGENPRTKNKNPREEEVERARCRHSSLLLLPLLFGALLCTLPCTAARVVARSRDRYSVCSFRHSRTPITTRNDFPPRGKEFRVLIPVFQNAYHYAERLPHCGTALELHYLPRLPCTNVPKYRNPHSHLGKRWRTFFVTYPSPHRCVTCSLRPVTYDRFLSYVGLCGHWLSKNYDPFTR